MSGLEMARLAAQDVQRAEDVLGRQERQDRGFTGDSVCTSRGKTSRCQKDRQPIGRSLKVMA
jgi:hypothetical protein